MFDRPGRVKPPAADVSPACVAAVPRPVHESSSSWTSKEVYRRGLLLTLRSVL